MTRRRTTPKPIAPDVWDGAAWVDMGAGYALTVSEAKARLADNPRAPVTIHRPDGTTRKVQ